MVGARATLPPAPPEPQLTGRVLVDGDLCDTRACPAIAFVRVYVYKPGTRTRDVLATLHWCAHHWRDVADKITEMQLDGRCNVIDETQHVPH